jgi:hypothetical protein
MERPQVGGHVKPGPVTAPEPPIVIVNAYPGGGEARPKTAETSVTLPIGNVHEAEPVHDAPQPEKVEPGEGLADSVTGVPRA